MRNWLNSNDTSNVANTKKSSIAGVNFLQLKIAIATELPHIDTTKSAIRNIARLKSNSLQLCSALKSASVGFMFWEKMLQNWLMKFSIGCKTKAKQDIVGAK